MNQVCLKHLPLLLKIILPENYVRTMNERERNFEHCAKSQISVRTAQKRPVLTGRFCIKEKE
jgi:hypothetical protein